MTLKDEPSHMTPLSTNAAGGKQSHIQRSFVLLPQEALAEVARIMYNGAQKYEPNNWRLIDTEDHINHALNHISLHLAGNTTEDHLAHATTRLMMALDLQTLEGN
jgi:hypothetical protein